MTDEELMNTSNLALTAAENARRIAALLHVEASKFGQSYYRLTKRSYDRVLMYYGLEQVMLMLARELEEDKDETLIPKDPENGSQDDSS